MRPEAKSETILGITRSKAKMYEYGVPGEHHIDVPVDPARLFSVSLGLLGDFASRFTSENPEPNHLESIKKDLLFSAHFFDAYGQSRLDQHLDPYVLLMGSASYYLCDFPGSSAVLARRLPATIQVECRGLETLMAWVLMGDYSQGLTVTEGFYTPDIEAFSKWLSRYFASGDDENGLTILIRHLKRKAYDNGSSRELLFADVVGALALQRCHNSTWFNLPRFSNQPTSIWLRTLQNPTFIRELWPAQRLLGEFGVLSGKSGVVQMPTSAGKTRATELVIRSAFLANRTDLAIVVAPFRALCHEIRAALANSFRRETVNVDELTDVFQADFDLAAFLQGKQILVVTPEKLLYVIRHNPELAPKIGVLIYDEGHQFDNGTRGVTFELLVTSLKALVPASAQTLLVSAVISNAESINTWLNGDEAVVVSGTRLGPTYRSLAFTSWRDSLGRMEFVSERDQERHEFYVPRVIEPFTLQKRKRERITREFPSRGDGSSIALYLGLKLVGSGSVAIFCGTKAVASSICATVVDIFDRGAPFEKPAELANAEEIERLCFLHERNLGVDSDLAKCARLGVFAHHGSTPHGIRLAVEHAMKEGLIKFIVCTSTLAQGVNLPIRYLVVTNIYQGGEKIKVRDFHNLIGRAGRSGMHTEGSILFANPDVFDQRKGKDGWRWDQVKELLHPENSEPCASTLLSIANPFHSDDRRYSIDVDPVDLVKAYITNQVEVDTFLTQIAIEHGEKKFTTEGLAQQYSEKRSIIAAIESYLMAYWGDDEEEISEPVAAELASRTLAFFLAKDKPEIQQRLVDVFKVLANNIASAVPLKEKRKIFGRTLFGVRDALALEEWVNSHIESLVQCETSEALIEIVWPVVDANVHNQLFRRCTSPEALYSMAIQWFRGAPYYELLATLTSANVRFGKGKAARYATLEHVVELCENAIAFEGMLVIGAVAEIVEQRHPEDEMASENLRILQKRVKYGLPSAHEVAVYELGFSDRAVSMDVAESLNAVTTPREAREELERNETRIRQKMDQYPSFFRVLLDRLI